MEQTLLSFPEFSLKILGESKKTKKKDPLRICQTNSGDDIDNENGGVFFYILLAIILLAALTYAVSQNNRGNTKLLTDEQARVAATEIIEYGNTVAAAVQKLRLRGCSDLEISFENNVTSTSNYNNSTSPIDNSCHVFDIVGGNVNYTKPNPSFFNARYSGSSFYQELIFVGGYRVIGVGTNDTDLIILIPFLNKQTCDAINNQLNLNEATTFDTFGGTGGGGVFTGQNNDFDPNSNPDIGDTATEFQNKISFCNRNASDYYSYITVLIAR